MLPPSRAYMAGGPHGPVKVSPLLQDMAPRPMLAPTPNASFLTEGNTITHSARSNQYLGMFSGTFRISIKTSPECFNRFCSLSCAEAETESSADTATHARIFRMIPPPSRFFAVFSGKRHDITSWVGAGNNLKVLGLGMRRQQRSTTMGELD